MYNKLKIVYIGGFEMPDKNAAAHRVLNNAKALRKLGHEVIFLGSKMPQTMQPATIDGFKNNPIEKATNVIKSITNINNTIVLLSSINDIDIIMLYNPHALLVLSILRYCKKRKIKLIIDVTEWYENKFSINPKKFVRYIDTELSMRYFYKKADGIIAISEMLNKYYKTIVSSTVVIPPLIDISDDFWISGKRNENAELREFVFTGTIDTNDKDDLGIIVKSFAELRQRDKFTVSILGVTEDEFIKTYRDSSKALQILGNNINFYGRVSHKESIDILKRAHYSILLRERTRKNMSGFPTKFVESYAAGIGIISNDFSDIRKYFPKDKNSKLIKNFDLSTLTKEMDSLLSNPFTVPAHREQIFDYRQYLNSIDALINDVMK